MFGDGMGTSVVGGSVGSCLLGSDGRNLKRLNRTDSWETREASYYGPVVWKKVCFLSDCGAQN